MKTMRHSFLVTAAASAAVLLPLAGAIAQTTTFRAITGTTSVRLDTATLASAASLNLTGATSSGTPFDSTFQVGFPFVAGTDFTFAVAGGFAPVQGGISHSGTVTFNGGTAQEVTLGNFRIGFDASRIGGNRSGFFVQNTVAPLAGVILFDVNTQLSPSLNAAAGTFSVVSGGLLVSAELGAFLESNGFATSNLAGAEVGEARIDGSFIIATDRTRPTVSLTGPRTVRARGVAAVVRGRAADDARLARVEFRLAGSSVFRRAAGALPNWSVRVVARNRPVTVFVRSVDSQGNRSAIQRVRVLPRR